MAFTLTQILICLIIGMLIYNSMNRKEHFSKSRSRSRNGGTRGVHTLPDFTATQRTVVPRLGKEAGELSLSLSYGPVPRSSTADAELSLVNDYQSDLRAADRDELRPFGSDMYGPSLLSPTQYESVEIRSLDVPPPPDNQDILGSLRELQTDVADVAASARGRPELVPE